MNFPNFIDGSYPSQSPITDAEQTLNWMVEIAEAQGATSKASLYPAPGYRAVVTGTHLGGRAAFAMGSGSTTISGRAFTVYGPALQEHFADGSMVVRNLTVPLAVDGNPAVICTNGDGGKGGGQLFLASGGNGYCYALSTNTLTLELTGGVTTVGQLYGFFVALFANANTIQISALFDGLTWDPTQFLQRTIGADPWTAMLVTPYGNILLPGSQTGEFLYNAGTFPFPFAPDPSGLIEEGVAATFSLKQAAKSAVWLSTNKNGGYQIMRAQGFTPQRISTFAVEQQIAGYARVDDAIGETYEDRGHVYYLLTFPTAGVTHVCDFNAGPGVTKWHKRGPWVSARNSFDAMHATFHCFAFNQHLLADRTTATLFEMNQAFSLDELGNPMRRRRRAPAIVSGRHRIFFAVFEVLLQSGLGAATGAGNYPVLLMRYSNDGGATWSTERAASAGPIGQFSQRVRFRRLGSGRLRVFEISCAELTPVRLTDAYLDLIPSTEAA